MKNSKNDKPVSEDSRNEIESHGFEKSNSESEVTVFVRFRLARDLPSRETEVRQYLGPFHTIKWQQMMKLAKAIGTLASRLLSIDVSETAIGNLLGFGADNARAGLLGIVRQKIEVELMEELHLAIILFLIKVTDIRPPGMDGDLMREDSLSQKVIELVEVIALEFLKQDGDVKIAVPIEVQCGEREWLCTGQFAPKPVVKIQDPIPVTLVGRPNAIIKDARKCMVKLVKGGSENIQFDQQKHLLKLLESMISEDNYVFEVMQVQDAQGRFFSVLENIGTKAVPTLF